MVQLINWKTLFQLKFLTFGLFGLLVKVCVGQLLDEESVSSDHRYNDHHQGAFQDLAQQFPTMPVKFCLAGKHCLKIMFSFIPKTSDGKFWKKKCDWTFEKLQILYYGETSLWWDFRQVRIHQLLIYRAGPTERQSRTLPSPTLTKWCIWEVVVLYSKLAVHCTGSAGILQAGRCPSAPGKMSWISELGLERSNRKTWHLSNTIFLLWFV